MRPDETAPSERDVARARTERKDRARLWRNAAPSHFILLVAVALIAILLLVTR